MQGKPEYIQLNLKATESHRLSWNNQYYNLEAVLLLNKKIESVEEAKQNLEDCSLLIKMNPFKNEFKAKLFSHILGEDKQEETPLIAFTVNINIFTKKLLNIHDIRQAKGTVNAYGNSPINANESIVVKLTDTEESSLILELQKLIDGNMLTLLREPFVCFFPEFLTNSWQERMPKSKTKGALIPFQAVFNQAGAIERVFKNELFALDDLYCPTPSCDCKEVNCIILTFDPHSQKEVVYGGFKYHFEKKTFKNLPDFPSNLNAQEWFKQFSLNYPINLPLLFEARYKFIRGLMQSKI